jgi:hypothetical protein
MLDHRSSIQAIDGNYKWIMQLLDTTMSNFMQICKKSCPNGVPSEEEKRAFFLKEEGKKKACNNGV